MRKVKALIGPPEKNGVRIIRLTKRKKLALKKLQKMCGKWWTDYKKLKKASPPGFYGKGHYEPQPLDSKRRGV